MTALAIEASNHVHVLQVNAITGDAYTKTNQSDLRAARSARGYASNKWLTFRQAIEIGLVVREGERGVRLVRVVDVTDKKTGKATKNTKWFSVFNIEQTIPLVPRKDAK